MIVDAPAAARGHLQVGIGEGHVAVLDVAARHARFIDSAHRRNEAGQTAIDRDIAELPGLRIVGQVVGEIFLVAVADLDADIDGGRNRVMHLGEGVEHIDGGVRAGAHQGGGGVPLVEVDAGGGPLDHAGIGGGRQQSVVLAHQALGQAAGEAQIGRDDPGEVALQRVIVIVGRQAQLADGRDEHAGRGVRGQAGILPGQRQVAIAEERA